MASSLPPPSDEEFRLLVSSVKDYAIFMLDPAGRVATWNAGARELKGYLAEEIIGKHVSVFYTTEDVAAGLPKRLLETAASEGRVQSEGYRVRKDGSRFCADVVITAVRDSSGRLRGFGKVTRDLTERQTAEAQRLELAQAQEAIRLRDEFLIVASHELRTPLAALQLQLDGLRSLSSAMDPKVAHKIERAGHATRRLTRLVLALLDVSRIATGKIELQPSRFDLVEAARDTVDGLRDAAGNARCDLVLDVPASPIEGIWDRLRVEQILFNLLSNAIKFGAGKPVRVTVREDDDAAVLEVTDRGPGVPEQDLRRIFGRYERGVSVDHYGGLGLGLYVVNELAEAHGGKVTVANTPDGGACFTVRLPRTASATPSP